MNLINNIGISYNGNYINQGSQIDKCKKATDIGAKYIEFNVRNDGKDTDFSNLTTYFQNELIFHLPTINTNQTNLKKVKELISTVLKNNIKLFVLDASTLTYETYDWSTVEEQQNYLKNMAKGIASLIDYNIDIAIENTYKDDEGILFGKTLSNISDLLVYTRNTLVEEYGFTREKANEKIGISLSLKKLRLSNEDLVKWLKVFNNDIKCIKVNNIENNLEELDTLLNELKDSEINAPILLETKEELEKITNEYKKFEFLVIKKDNNQPLNFDNYQVIEDSKYNEYNYNMSSNQGGFTNIVIVAMILLTIIIAVMMFALKLR